MNFSTLQSWFSGSLQVWQIFGYLNLLAATGFLLLAGYQRAWDKRAWTLLVSSFVFGSGLGSMLLPSIMGALLGGALTFLAIKRLIRFPHPSADLFVLYMIVFIGIGRLGCLFSGCCFGTITDLPWGIQYNTGTLAHWLHFHTGQQAYLHEPSLRVHPVQLYETLALLGIALPATLVAIRRKLAAALILSGFLAFYFLLRFGLEFLRGMSNVWWSEIYIGPLSVFQIFLLSVALTAAIASFSLLKRKPVKDQGSRGGFLEQPLVFGGLILGTLLLSDRFQRIQLVLLLILFSLNLFLSLPAWMASQERTIRMDRRWAMGLTSLLLILSTQAFFSDPGTSKTPIFQKSRWLYDISLAGHDAKLVRLGDRRLSYEDYLLRKQIFYHVPDTSSVDSSLHQKAMADLEDPVITYSLGGAYTSYTFELATCGGEPVTEHVQSSAFLASIDRERRRSENITSYLQGRLEFGSGHVTPLNQINKNWHNYLVTTLLGGLDGEIIGAGLGLSFLGIRSLEADDFFMLPGGYLRLGPREFHIESGLNDRYYQQLGLFNMHLNLGHKPTEGLGWQLGIGSRGPLPISGVGYYTTLTNLKLGERLLLDLTLAVLGPDLDGLGTTILIRIPQR